MSYGLSRLVFGLGMTVLACGGSRAPAGVATQRSSIAASPSAAASATSGTASPRELTGYDFGKVPPRLFDTAGEGLAIYAWGRGQYLVSHDQGRTFTEIAAPSDNPINSYGQGWLQAAELLVRPATGVYRSLNGGGLEYVANPFPRDTAIGAGPLFRDGQTTYIIAGALYGWDEQTNRLETLTEKLPLVLNGKHWLASAAAAGDSLLVLVRSEQDASLFFSADRGRSWKTVAPPAPGVFVGNFATSAQGLVAETGNGVWLLSGS